jgi:hypothetical protein
VDEYELPDEHNIDEKGEANESETNSIQSNVSTSEGSSDRTTDLGGWWSDLNIIASLPDTKLRETIARYRSLLKSLECEMARRRTENISVRATSQFDVVYGMHRFIDVRRKTRAADAAYNRKERGPVSPRRTAKQLELTPEQLVEALDLLRQIKKKGSE